MFSEISKESYKEICNSMKGLPPTRIEDDSDTLYVIQLKGNDIKIGKFGNGVDNNKRIEQTIINLQKAEFERRNFTFQPDGVRVRITNNTVAEYERVRSTVQGKCKSQNLVVDRLVWLIKACSNAKLDGKQTELSANNFGINSLRVIHDHVTHGLILKDPERTWEAIILDEE